MVLHVVEGSHVILRIGLHLTDLWVLYLLLVVVGLIMHQKLMNRILSLVLDLILAGNIIISLL
jgi:hypothetical protein